MDPFHSHDMKYLLSFPIPLLKTGILTLLFMVGFHCKLLYIFISYETILYFLQMPNDFTCQWEDLELNGLNNKKPMISKNLSKYNQQIFSKNINYKPPFLCQSCMSYFIELSSQLIDIN